MCQYKIYHQSEWGYVVKCNGCEHLQLAFGTIAITFTYEQFDEFVETVCEYYEAYKDECFREQKTLRIPTAAQSISLAFSINEMEQLMNMLNETLVLMQANERLTFRH